MKTHGIAWGRSFVYIGAYRLVPQHPYKARAPFVEYALEDYAQ